MEVWPAAAETEEAAQVVASSVGLTAAAMMAAGVTAAGDKVVVDSAEATAEVVME